MKGGTQVAKGRIEEAAGVIAGNPRLRIKGRADQAAGHVKQAAGKVVNKAAKRLKK